jgi:hypothetical protein
MMIEEDTNYPFISLSWFFDKTLTLIKSGQNGSRNPSSPVVFVWLVVAQCQKSEPGGRVRRPACARSRRFQRPARRPASPPEAAPATNSGSTPVATSYRTRGRRSDALADTRAGRHAPSVFDEPLPDAAPTSVRAPRAVRGGPVETAWVGAAGAAVPPRARRDLLGWWHQRSEVSGIENSAGASISCFSCNSLLSFSSWIHLCSYYRCSSRMTLWQTSSARTSAPAPHAHSKFFFVSLPSNSISIHSFACLTACGLLAWLLVGLWPSFPLGD